MAEEPKAKIEHVTYSQRSSLPEAKTLNKIFNPDCGAMNSFMVGVATEVAEVFGCIPLPSRIHGISSYGIPIV